MSWRAQGSRAWLMQRISAVYLAIYIVMFGLYLLFDAPVSYSAWRAWMGWPVITVATSGFFAALLMHAWVGLRDVIMDYVHPAAMRFILLVSVALGLFALGLWVLRILMLTPLPMIMATSDIRPPWMAEVSKMQEHFFDLPLAALMHPCTAGAT